MFDRVGTDRANVVQDGTRPATRQLPYLQQVVPQRWLDAALRRCWASQPRAVPTHDRGSRGLSMVVVEHATESLSAQHRAAYGCVVVCRGDELVAQRARPRRALPLDPLVNEDDLAPHLCGRSM